MQCIWLNNAIEFLLLLYQIILLWMHLHSGLPYACPTLKLCHNEDVIIPVSLFNLLVQSYHIADMIFQRCYVMSWLFPSYPWPCHISHTCRSDPASTSSFLMSYRWCLLNQIVFVFFPDDASSVRSHFWNVTVSQIIQVHLVILTGVWGFLIIMLSYHWWLCHIMIPMHPQSHDPESAFLIISCFWYLDTIRQPAFLMQKGYNSL